MLQPFLALLKRADVSFQQQFCPIITKESDPPPDLLSSGAALCLPTPQSLWKSPKLQTRAVLGGGGGVPKLQYCKNTVCGSYVQPWLVAIGGWQQWAGGGWWWFGWWYLGAVLNAGPEQKKKWGSLKTALMQTNHTASHCSWLANADGANQNVIQMVSTRIKENCWQTQQKLCYSKKKNC